MKVFKIALFAMLVLVAASILAGCGALNTAMKYKDPEVQGMAVTPAQLPFMAQGKRKVAVRIVDTTEFAGMVDGVKAMTEARLAKNGWEVVQSRFDADYVIVGVIAAKKDTKSAGDLNPESPYDTATASTIAGATLGALTADNAVTGGLVGAAVGMVGGYAVGGMADALINVTKLDFDMYLTVFRKLDSKATMTTMTAGARGADTKVSIRTDEDTEWMEYKGLYVVNVTKLDLDWEEVRTISMEQLSSMAASPMGVY